MTLEKFFVPKDREADIYATTESAGVFALTDSVVPASAPIFSIAMPPPNANGELHLGHALGYSLMDALGRFHRANGHRVCLLPGKDHAGIQTQVTFEKKLRKEGVDLSQKTPEELYEACYAFCTDRAQYMRAQERTFGLTADWSKELFTLDPRLNKIVFETFEKLHQDGLVYKGKRIVNWSVHSQTSISDIEVEYIEAKGNLWYIRYPYAESVNLPQRDAAPYPTAAVDKSWTDGRVLLFAGKAPILQPGTLVTKDDDKQYLVFSCGDSALAEVEIFSKGQLSASDTLALGGSVDAGATGAAHNKATMVGVVYLVPVQDLAGGLVTATTRPETMLGDTALCVHPKDPRYAALVGKKVQVPLTSRTVAIIADDRADPFYGTGVIKITPAHDFLDYDIGVAHNLEVLSVIGEDGNMTAAAGAAYAGLSIAQAQEKVVADLGAAELLLQTRPITHKVPISERGKDVIQPLVSEQWFIAVDKPGNSLKAKVLEFVRSGKINIYPERFRAHIEQWLENLRDWNVSRQLWWGHRMPVYYKDGKVLVSATPPTESGWIQETDTFDTWFSSGQWAFSTMIAHGLGAFPGQNSPSMNLCPNHTMVMGRDILMFWACRMLLLTAYRMNDIPWRNIFFTGLVRDEKGQKMSKSAGNGIDPLQAIEKYGADAIRIALIIGSGAGNDTNLGEKKIEGYSKFINKLWNAGKLIELKVGEAPVAAPSSLTLSSSTWILQQLAQVQGSVRKHFEQYELSLAIDELYSFVWMTFCDWYLECMKAIVDQGTPAQAAEAKYVVCRVFSEILSLLHPFAPFVTEELYQKLAAVKDTAGLLIRRQWQPVAVPPVAEQPMLAAIAAVSSIRSVKAALTIGSQRTRASVDWLTTKEQELIVSELAKVDLVPVDQIPESMRLRKPCGKHTVICEVEGKEKYFERLQAELQTQQSLIAQIEKKLSGQFATHAKPELVQAEREKLVAAKNAVATISEELQAS